MQRYVILSIGIGFALAVIFDNKSFLHAMTSAALIVALIHIWNDEE